MSASKQVADLLDKVLQSDQSEAIASIVEKKTELLENLLDEINTALADLVDGLDERNKQMARGIADAMSTAVAKVLQQPVKVEAPQVTVQPRIEVNVPKQDAPVVSLQRGKVHLVGRVLTRDPMGRMETFEIKSKE
jgi:hypothetical protein